MFKALGIDRSCLLAINGRNEVLQKSARNIDRTTVTSVQQLNAWDILRNRTLLLTRDGALRVYSYPEFKPLATHQIGIVATQAVAAGKHGRLYVAGVDPRTVGERPRAKGVGDVFVFELKDVLGRGQE